MNQNLKTLSIGVVLVVFLSSSFVFGAVIESKNQSKKNPPVAANLEGVRCLIYFGKYLDRNPSQIYKSQAEVDEVMSSLVPNKNCAQIVNNIKYEEFNGDQRAAVEELLEYIHRRILIPKN